MSRKRTGGGNEERRIHFDDDHLRDLHGSGKTAYEIASLYGCSPHPVKMALKRLCLRRPAKQRPGTLAGPNNPAWKGGRRQRGDGYIIVWTPDGERLEHQVVMEQVIGRKLKPGEVVHHLDGNKANNAPSNLSLTNQSDHIREHLPEMQATRYRR